MSESNKLESLEERQWRQKAEQAHAKLAEEEAEWSTLRARAQAALAREEREWERLRTRAELKSSGAFLAHPDDEVRVSKLPELKPRR
ncbi:MAG: hypothetical protein QM778_20940 [Myxococcales bacterium]